MGCCDAKRGLIAGAALGALVAVLGGILMPVGDSIIKGTVSKEAVIEPGTTAYETWVSTAVPVYRQFWIFDVKNPLEVIHYGAKPVLVEKGPYTYRTRFLPKENITFHNNGTVAFLLPNGAIFEPSMSVGPEEDNVTTLNMAVAAAYYLVPKVLHGLLNTAMKNANASLFQYRSVKELLWGYHDPLIRRNVGLFSPYNGTFDGFYNVYTGKDDISKAAIIDSWKGERELPFWGNPYCNMINGTDGSTFPPFLKKKEPLYFFSSEICRSVSAEFTRKLELKGIEMYRYMLPPMILASPTKNPDNMCFCKDPVITFNCTLGGVLDIGACNGGVPVFISLPHFLYGSPILQETVVGLRPSEEHHSIFLDVEPITGFTMRFAKRLQINMIFGPSDKITVLNKIKNLVLFPMAWLNESATLDDETAERFRVEVTSRVELLDAMEVTLLSVGTAVCVFCVVAGCVLHRRSVRKSVA